MVKLIWLHMLECIEDNIEEPSTYEDAVSCSDSGKWMVAMQ